MAKRAFRNQALAFVVACGLSAGGAAAQGLSGISRLAAVTQEKTENANDAAAEGAESQRDLIESQSQVRGQLRAFEEQARTASESGAQQVVRPSAAVIQRCRNCTITIAPANSDSDDDDK